MIINLLERGDRGVSHDGEGEWDSYEMCSLCGGEEADEDDN